MKLITSLVALILAGNLHATSTADYLPADANPDPAVPTPESVLGWEVGDWHVSHDKLVHYMQALAAASPRVSLRVIGHTHEQRPLLQLAITSATNQGRLEELRRAHLAGDGPLVVWLGYSVHGNEASGSNASLLAAYYLASSRSAFVNELLEGSVVLIDPSINPDGLNRFASWANSNAGRVPVTDPATRQHSEHWPGGRTNHYWFDLNRDWLPLVHPESRARVAEYHRWLPHLLTDHHEQGGYPGYFFQPGVPSRQNPLTPDDNLALTRALAEYHAAAMDQAGQPYFTEDAYDDFYFGKGSTYPDINGSVGILFEQKAIRGQALETTNGVETFRMAVANQLRMSLSSLHGAWALRDRFKAYQAGFHDTMLERAANRDFEAWVIGDDGDPGRAAALLELFDLHRVEYAPLGRTLRAGGHEFRAGNAWVIPARQRQFGLAEAMMEQRTQFQDNTFYDVSAWTLPLAYNLPYATLARMPETGDATESSRGLAPDPDARAWAIPWNQLGAAPLLQRLLDAGARVRVALKPFTGSTPSGLVAFQRGTLVIQDGVQDAERRAGIRERLSEGALAGLQVHGLQSTMTNAGPDLGSEHFALVRPVKPLLLGGKGISPYAAGDQWFLLDHRLELATPVVEPHNLAAVDLDEYTHLMLADGSFTALRKAQRQRIGRWVRKGGILVAGGRAATWVEESLCFEADEDDCADANTEDSESTPEEPVARRAYADFDDDKARQTIGGAIAAGVIDLTHPLGFGFVRPELPLFRRGTAELQPSENPYSTPLRYTQEPLMAGFIGTERLDAMRGAPALIAEKQGDGLVVRFANSPLFRGFWRGTERMYLNALYFGQVVRETNLPRFPTHPRPEAPRHH